MVELKELLPGIFDIHWQQLVMIVVGGLLIYLAIAKEYEPALLLPIGFGAILVNLPLAIIWEGTGEHVGLLQVIYNAGIESDLIPCLLFIGIGAMTDFRPLFQNPRMVFFGAAAQVGIFMTIVAVVVLTKVFGLDFTFKDAMAIGIIGAADGPTTIVVAKAFGGQYMGPIMVAAYSYMSLVPIIQPPVIKLLTTKKERRIRMEYSDIKVKKSALIVFPILVTVVAVVLAPASAPLIGLLMFGNLLREATVVERLNKAAQNELANIVTLLLGITVGATMHYKQFLTVNTLVILGLGLVAFVFVTAGGVLFAKFLNLFTKKKVNPMIGGAGISAFPMSARVVQKMATAEDPYNFILMPAISANVSGQIGSVIAGGVVLTVGEALARLIGG